MHLLAAASLLLAGIPHSEYTQASSQPDEPGLLQPCVCRPLTNPIPILVKSKHITSGFGLRIHPFTGECNFHRGLDIAATKGTRILPLAPGFVEKVEKQKWYGRIVIVNHGKGITTLYAHMKKVYVRVGDRVNLNTQLGEVGMSGRTTGPHLHFELRVVEEHIDPRKSEELFQKVFK